MTDGKTLRRAIALLAIGAGSVAAPWHGAGAQSQPAVTTESERAVIAAVRDLIAHNYVVGEKRAPLDAILAKGLASGRYHALAPDELANRVTEDLTEVAHDKHLSLSYQPDVSAHLPPFNPNDDSDDSNDPFFKAAARRQNYGVSDLKLLDGNVRLLTYDGYVQSRPESDAAIDRAMAFLRDGDAAIIDLRGNGGGSGEAVEYMTSYFVAPKTRLIANYFRDKPPVDSVSTAVPGGPIKDIPIYVLIGPATGSAAEEFASHVKQFGFGTLIGQPTAGAGYHNELLPIPGGFVLSISNGRAILPDGTNWESVGVPPKVSVDVDLALDAAMQAALTQLAPKAQGPERTILEWSAAIRGARVHPVTPHLPLTAYAGRYGTRTVAVDSGRLTYQSGKNPKAALIPIEPDLFALERFPHFRLRFTVTGETVTGFDIERADGSRTPVPRS